ncbi:DUF4244 domain-containing protein [Streptomyces sp. NPDC003300]|uniref:DUF4244 domain-containing protein n=1 Tax=unclassified Streptomyces TaxID=2593676 RepID=UPI0033A5F453
MTHQTMDQHLARTAQPALTKSINSINSKNPPGAMASAPPALRVPPVPRAVRLARAERRRWVARMRRRAARYRDVSRTAAEAGMSTAEYAVGTIAACGFAAVLYKIVTSGPVRSALTGVIVKALHVPF